MSDNIQLNSGSGGQLLRALDDGTTIFPVGITGFATTIGTPDVCSIVTPTTGLPVRLADGSGYLATLPVSMASVPSHAVTNAGTFAVQATQTGAWTVDLGATDNAVLDAIAASVAGTLTISAASLPLPSGAATAANQATANASLATLAGAVAGTEVQVDVLTMPTVAVTGTFWQATQPVSGTITAQDGGGSLTVDAPVGTPLFVRLSDGTDPLATLPVSLASVPSHAVTNAGTFAVQVDNTVTVAAHAVTNAGTFAVQAAQSGTWNVTNISGTVSLPTGAATAAKQPAIGTAGTASADVITVQGVASMTPLLVNGSGVTQPVSGTVTAELSATDNAVLDAIAASLAGTLTVTGGGGGTEYTEGATDASITGSAILWEDTGDTLRAVSAAKPLPIGDAGGSLTVDGTVAATQSGGWTVDLGATDNAVLDAIAASVAGTLTVGSHAVTNAGTFAVQAAQSGTWNVTNVSGTVSLPTGAATLAEQQSQTTALQLLDNIVHVDDAAYTLGTHSGVMMMGFAGTQSVDANDAAALSCTTAGALRVNVENTLTVSSHAVTNAGTFAVQAAQSGAWTVDLGATDNAVLDAIAASVAGTLTVGTHAVTQSGTWTVTGTGGTFPVTDSGGSLTVDAPVATPVFVRLSDGSSAITTLPVSLASVPSHAVTNAGTFAVQATQSGTWNVGTVTTCSTLTTLANGQTAHDSASTGSPLRIGAKAETALSGITLVADGDATDLYAGVDGVLIVRPNCNLEDVVQERTTNTDGASTAFASGLAAPGAGIRLYVKSVTICNSSATFCTVDLRDGTAGSVLWTFPVPATGGVTHTFDPPLKLSANTALAFDASAATTTLTLSVNGFKSKV